jgi:hypothetical protein
MRIDLAVRTAKPTFIVRALAIVLAVTVLVGTGILLTKVAPAGQSENLLPLASSQGQSSTRTEASAPAQQVLTSTQVTQTLTISPKKPTVGTEVRATANGLPANKSVELIWKTMQGAWVIEDYYHFKGKKFTEASRSLGTAVVGPDGRLDAPFTIPEDYGGVHEVVVIADRTVLAQGGVEVTQAFEISPKSGPVGTLIEIRGTGLGWRTMESTWVVNWDNSNAGWISAVTTPGTAIARFRASGALGEHFIKVYTGYMAQSYLNFEQAPNAYLPRPDFTFTITPGGSVSPAYAEPYQAQPVPAVEAEREARLEINPAQGPVQTRATLRGEGLPAGTTVSLVWETWAGSRVSGRGFEPKETPMGDLQVSRDGRLDVPFTVPEDLGGLHALVVKSGDSELARTHFVIETSIVSISPASGPVGTKVTIHLKGVGWTEYDNIYVASYDNAYMGYICGFNSQGDVEFSFAASGEPGVHLIDMYPGIYQGPAEGQQLYRLPQLTYREDHPGNKIPALRFAFEVTR